ncbi:MAG TPA: type II toxin-antitoxin system HigB family toxin [Bacteroides sp.]|nr:type II toxin-antitoxin system HigB family toxin [Bacteroides sp.]
MHVISYKRIKEFIKDHPDSVVKLGRWYKWMKKGKFNNLNEIKRKFSGVDYVGDDRYVFNISGNKYRLVALINFCKQKVYVRFIGTHSEYEKINCNTV